MKIKRVLKKKLLQRIKTKENKVIIIKKLLNNNLLLQMILIEIKKMKEKINQFNVNNKKNIRSIYL